MIKLLRNTRFWFALSIVAIDILFFTITNPNRGSSVMLMVGFLLLVVTLYSLLSVLFVVTNLYGVSMGGHHHRLALYGTGLIAGLLALQSIGELSLRDALIFVPLAAIFYAYLSYGRLKLEA